MNPEQDDVMDESLESFAYNSVEPLKCQNGGKVDALGWCVWWDEHNIMHKEKPVFKGIPPVSPNFDSYMSDRVKPRTLISPGEDLYSSVKTGGEISGQERYE